MAARSSSPVRLLAAVGILALMLAGCADSIEPLASPGDPPVETPPVETPPGVFPPVSGSAEVYDRKGLTSSGHLSRYVLYDDGTFELQFVSGRGFGAYPGRYYVKEGSNFYFLFHTGSIWIAKGTLESTSLRVEYNAYMLLSDFEDGVYIRSEEHQTSP